MISAYNSLIAYEGDKWGEYLDRLMLADVFGGLILEYPDPSDFKAIVKYILYAYSAESDMIQIGADWAKNKKKIFEYCCIKPDAKYFNDLVHLENKAVLIAIKKWLDYQDNDLFELIQTLKDLRAELQLTCLAAIRKSSGEIDYDQKNRNAQYAIELRTKIKDLESELIQSSQKLKNSVKEFREAKQNSKSMGVETFLKQTEN